MSAAAEIVVVGGGIVGLSAALALARLPRTAVTLLERGPLTLPAPTRHAAFDQRVYALTPHAQQFLATLGVMARLDPMRVAPVYAMEIFDHAELALTFARAQALAHIVEHAHLRDHLIAAARATPNLTMVENTSIHAAFGRVAGGYALELDSGEKRDCDLLIGADGADSRVRALLGIDVDVRDFESVGLIANFACERPHRDTARQWFSHEGVLAYLPLPGQQMSMVWSLAQARGEALKALSATAFAAAVAAAGQSALGALRLLSPVTAIPLRRTAATCWVRQGAALLGDAAHTLHPLAGQGLNLGLGDVSTLAATLAARGALARVGDLALLRRYARARREPTLAMQSATEGLRALFASESAPLVWGRQRGLKLLQRVPALKAAFTEYAGSA